MIPSQNNSLSAPFLCLSKVMLPVDFRGHPPARIQLHPTRARGGGGFLLAGISLVSKRPIAQETAMAPGTGLNRHRPH